MILTIVSTAAVLSMWVILWLAFSGFAHVLSMVCGWRILEPTQRLMVPFVGYVVGLGILQVWQSFLPISPWTFVLFVTFGLVAFFVNNRICLWAVSLMAVSSWKQYLLMVPAIAWLANRSIGPNTLWDAGLYHLSFVRWASTYAAVPGLGNLHDRLAFNNPSLLVHSMLELGPALGGSAHLVNGLLCAFWIPVLIWSAEIIKQGESRRSGSAFLGLAASVPISNIAVTTAISSTNTDVPAIMLSFAGCWMALRFLEESGDGGFSGDRATNAGMALVMLSGASVVKLSASILALSAIAAMVVDVAILKRRSLRQTYQVFGVRSIVFSALLVIVWMTRGIILSGYPAYPLTWFATDVSWRIDRATADEQREFITTSARLPFPLATGDPNDAGWFFRWLIHVALLRAPVIIALPAILILVSCLVLAFPRRARDALREPVFPLAVAVAIAIGVWLISAPSPRFGGHLWWMFAAFSLGVVANPGGTAPSPNVRRLWLAIFASFTLLPIFHQMTLIHFHYRFLQNHPFSGRSVWMNLPIQVVASFPSSLPRAALEPRRTKSGLEVLVPSEGLLCWDAPLLCITPQAYDHRLRLRSPENLADGFTTAPAPPEVAEEFPDY